MSKFKLDIFYDITCHNCTRTRSKDFNKGASSNKEELLTNAEKEGWRVIEGKNF